MRRMPANSTTPWPLHPLLPAGSCLVWVSAFASLHSFFWSLYFIKAMESLTKESSHGISRFSLSKDSLEKLRMCVVLHTYYIHTTVCMSSWHRGYSALPSSSYLYWPCAQPLTCIFVLLLSLFWNCLWLFIRWIFFFWGGGILETSHGHEFMSHSDIKLTVI